MDSPLGPDGRPAVFDGGAWITQDRRYWWNGAAWVPLQPACAGFPLVNIGIGIVFVAIAGYVVYSLLATESAYTIGFYIGVIAFFGILVAVYRFAGRWGWFGILVRAVSVALGLLKVLTLIAHPPPA